MTQAGALTEAGVKTEGAPGSEESHTAMPVRSKIKPYGFTLFIKRYGVDRLLDCLEENEKRGIVYHREGINGDYDDFDDVEKLIEFIKTGDREKQSALP